LSPASPSSPQVPELCRPDSSSPDLPCRCLALLSAQGEPPHPAPALPPLGNLAPMPVLAGRPASRAGRWAFPLPSPNRCGLGLLGRRGH
jgi:hypothetical protein